MDSKFVIGLDYGSDSARAIVVNALTGETLATAVQYYPRWQKGLYCNPAINQYRQHPQDYIDVLEGTVKEALAQCPAGTAEQVVGIAFDTTGSTPALTDASGTPLALLPEFSENPNAMFILWKDHTAIQEAAEINKACKEWDIDYSAYEGGIYSSEWYWAKALHVLRADETIRAKAYSIVEYCEWLPALITGVKTSSDIVRSRCACGHKAMWHEKWGGLPSDEFLTKIDPLLTGFRDRLFEKTETADKPVGHLTEEWAARLGLTTKVVVAGGAFDCHMGAVGAGVTPHTFVRVIGTSTCDVMVASYEEIGHNLIKGICGQVDGSVIPGMIGLEAGQSGFGDIYAWFKRVLEFPLHNIIGQSALIDEATKEKLIAESIDRIIPALTAEAEKIPVSESHCYRLDERTPYTRCQSVAERNNHRTDIGQYGSPYLPRTGRSDRFRFKSHCRPIPQRRRTDRQRDRYRRYCPEVPFRDADIKRCAGYAYQSLSHRPSMRIRRRHVCRHRRRYLYQSRGCTESNELRFRQRISPQCRKRSCL